MFYGQTKSSLKHRKRDNIYKNSTGTNYFDPKTFKAISYNWWQYLAKIKGKLVFNAYSYSNSTSGHQFATRALLKDLGLKIDVTVHVRAGLQRFQSEALKPLYTRLFKAELAASRKGVQANRRLVWIEQAKVLRTEIKLFRSLGAKLSLKAQAGIKRGVMQAETQRLERNRAERKSKPQRSKTKLIRESGTFEIVM